MSVMFSEDAGTADPDSDPPQRFASPKLDQPSAWTLSSLSSFMAADISGLAACSRRANGASPLSN
ncbi:MAG: hypothetical protein H6650_15740 [Ardenticatenales bacterium]|nr:hypothetical protein [Ardenticatenales bacterium]